MEQDPPLYSVTLLHQRSLVHGLDPAIHVLLRVRAEEICPHPAVFCLWANHRVPIVNVGAHSRMGRLSKRERDQRGETGWMRIYDSLKTGKSGQGIWGIKNCAFLVDGPWPVSTQWEQSNITATFCWKKTLQQKQNDHYIVSVLTM